MTLPSQRRDNIRFEKSRIVHLQFETNLIEKISTDEWPCEQDLRDDYCLESVYDFKVMGNWLIHVLKLAYDFKIMGDWLIHVLKLAYDSRIMGHWLIHVLKLAYNLGNYHEIVGNA